MLKSTILVAVADIKGVVAKKTKPTGLRTNPTSWVST